MEYSVNKVLKKIILVGVLTLFVMMMILSFNDLKSIMEVVRKANLLYTFYAFLCLLAYFIIYPSILCILGYANKTKISQFKLYLISMTEFFFNGITPFATGGQPFQVYMLNEYEVKPSESTGLLLMNFLITQVTINLFTIVSLILYFNKLDSSISDMKSFIIIGFCANMLITLLFLGVSTLKIFRVGITKLLILFSKIKFLNKFLTPKIDAFEQYVINSQVTFKKLWKKKMYLLISLIVKIISYVFFFSIPFFVLKALGIEVNASQIIFTICMTSFVLTIVAWFPTPGASGGIELVFKALFASIPLVTDTIALGQMLIWRLMTYYMLMILSMFAYLMIASYKKRDITNTKIETGV